jgi:hypothetical protein
MATEMLLVGPITTLTQNVVYAMPGIQCLLFSNVALQQSNTSDFALNSAVAALTSVEIAAAYIRCTTGAAIVRVVTNK